MGQIPLGFNRIPGPQNGTGGTRPVSIPSTAVYRKVGLIFMLAPTQLNQLR
jgi:hypothetical protein